MNNLENMAWYLTSVFIVLKLLELLTWSWWCVLIPLVSYFALRIMGTVLCIGFGWLIKTRR